MDRQYNRTRVKGQTMNHKTLNYKGRVTLRPHKLSELSYSEIKCIFNIS